MASTSRQTAHSLRSRFKEATREAILAAAEQRFGEDGFEAARMEDIAAGAGLSVGTLYNYFADRKALAQALVEDRRAELFARLDQALKDGKKEPFETRLRLWLKAAFAHFVAHQKFISLMLEATHWTHGQMRRPMVERVTQLVQPAIREGVLRSDGSELHGTFLLGMVKGAFSRSFDGDQPFDPDAATEAIIRFFLEGAGKRKG